MGDYLQFLFTFCDDDGINKKKMFNAIFVGLPVVHPSGCRKHRGRSCRKMELSIFRRFFRAAAARKSPAPRGPFRPVEDGGSSGGGRADSGFDGRGD